MMILELVISSVPQRLLNFDHGYNGFWGILHSRTFEKMWPHVHTIAKMFLTLEYHSNTGSVRSGICFIKAVYNALLHKEVRL